MTYREKIAWLSLFAMVVTYAPYFTLVTLNPPGAVPDLRTLGLFGLVSVARMVILGLGVLIIGAGAREEARARPDERDLEIRRRALSGAYSVLLMGMILVGCIMPFTSGGWSIVNAALVAIVAAEIVRYGVMVASYRRGVHA